MMELGANRYGKAAIRIVRVGRDDDAAPTARPDRRDRPRGRLHGRPHRRRQRQRRGHRHDEEHGLRLRPRPPRTARSSTTRAPSRGTSSRCRRSSARRSTSASTPGSPIEVDGAPGARRLRPDGGGDAGRDGRRDTATGLTVEAGVEDLVVMKTTRSAFEGFPRDRFTTLAETDDRLMATKVTAVWRYGTSDIDDFDAAWTDVRRDAPGHVRRPRQPERPDEHLDHGQRHARAARGARRDPDGAAQPAPLDGRPRRRSG